MKRTLNARLVAAATTTGLAIAALVGFGGPAHAAPGDTIATFAITAGSLSISVPASTVALGTGTVNTGASTAAGQLGTVTVTDNRGALVNTWTTTVSSTTFVTGTSTTSETVALANIAYSSGAFTSHSGLGVFVPGSLATMTSAGTGAAYTGAAGNSVTAWNPTLTFTLISSQVAGTYTGTINHAVA